MKCALVLDVRSDGSLCEHILTRQPQQQLTQHASNHLATAAATMPSSCKTECKFGMSCRYIHRQSAPPKQATAAPTKPPAVRPKGDTITASATN